MAQKPQDTNETRTLRIRKAIGRALMRALLLAVLGTAGCGGGVSNTAMPSGGPAPAPAQKAIISLATSGSLSGSAIGGLGITVNLPDTVTVKTTDGANVDSGVVAASGVAAGQATVLALYTAATASAPAKLYLVLASGGPGMPVGEFATITCEVKSGSDPAASDFSLSDFSAVDTSGVALPLTAGLTEAVQ